MNAAEAMQHKSFDEQKKKEMQLPDDMMEVKSTGTLMSLRLRLLKVTIVFHIYHHIILDNASICLHRHYNLVLQILNGLICIAHNLSENQKVLCKKIPRNKAVVGFMSLTMH